LEDIYRRDGWVNGSPIKKLITTAPIQLANWLRRRIEARVEMLLAVTWFVFAHLRLRESFDFATESHKDELQ
jgi:hypothetical protein